MAARLLLVDDEPDVARAVADLLEVALPGASVAIAASGAEALERLRGERFDLVLTDYRMPGMDGIELLAQAAAAAPAVPRIMMTAYADLDVVLTAVNRSRPRAFLMKPIEPEDLVREVETVLLQTRALGGGRGEAPPPRS